MRARFSSPVRKPSTATAWPVTPMAARTASGSLATSWPSISTWPASGARRVVRMLQRGGLARAIRPEQREDRPCGDLEVDAVEDDLLAV